MSKRSTSVSGSKLGLPERDINQTTPANNSNGMVEPDSLLVGYTRSLSTKKRRRVGTIFSPSDNSESDSRTDSDSESDSNSESGLEQPVHLLKTGRNLSSQFASESSAGSDRAGLTKSPPIAASSQMDARHAVNEDYRNTGQVGAGAPIQNFLRKMKTAGKSLINIYLIALLDSLTEEKIENLTPPPQDKNLTTSPPDDVLEYKVNNTAHELRITGSGVTLHCLESKLQEPIPIPIIFENILPLAQVLGVEEEYKKNVDQSWSIAKSSSPQPKLPGGSQSVESTASNSPKLRERTELKEVGKFRHYQPLKSQGIWSEDRGKDRGTRFKVLDGIYDFENGREELNPQKHNIERTMLSIIHEVMKTIQGSKKDYGNANLTLRDVCKLIEKAQENGGISNTLKRSGDGYEPSQDAPEPWKKKFSALFQARCADCGIYSGRNSFSEKGMRLTHLPLSVCEQLKGMQGEKEIHKDRRDLGNGQTLKDIATQVSAKKLAQNVASTSSLSV